MLGSYQKDGGGYEFYYDESHYYDEYYNYGEEDGSGYHQEYSTEEQQQQEDAPVDAQEIANEYERLEALAFESEFNSLLQDAPKPSQQQQPSRKEILIPIIQSKAPTQAQTIQFALVTRGKNNKP